MPTSYLVSDFEQQTHYQKKKNYSSIYIQVLIKEKNALKDCIKIKQDDFLFLVQMLISIEQAYGMK